MPKLKFAVAEIQCTFWEWMPKQNLFAVDFGNTEESREETIRWMWKRFVKILQSVEEAE